MARSASRRPGFSLIELTLAGLVGSSLVVAMIYMSRELNLAVQVVFTEAALQGVARDLGDDVDARVPVALAQFAQTNGAIGMSMDRFSAPNAGGSLAAVPGLACGALGFSSALLLGAAGGHSNPKFGNGANATPLPTLAPVAPGALPAYTQAAGSNGATLTLGTWRLRFEDSPPAPDGGGRMLVSDATGTWRPMGTLGQHGMLANTNFSYGQWQPPAGAVYTGSSWLVDPAYQAVAFSINPAVAPSMVKLTSKLGRSGGVPFYLQEAWSPRVTSWTSYTVTAPGPVPDGSFNVPSAPYFPGGLFPVAVDLSFLKTAVKGTTTVDVWNAAGPGNIGWLSWNDDNSQPYLDSELQALSTQSFVDHNMVGNNVVKVGSGVSGLPGGKNPAKTIVDGWAAQGKTVTALCYSSSAYNGSNLVYTVAAFANFQLTTTSSAGATGSDYLKFLGWSDANGLPLPPGYTPF